jgi:hypothetical protein
MPPEPQAGIKPGHVRLQHLHNGLHDGTRREELAPRRPSAPANWLMKYS